MFGAEEGVLRRAALRELRRIRSDYRHGEDPRRLISDLSVLLRRLALGRSPRSQVAGLTGEAWLRYLDEAMGEDDFTHGPGRHIALSPYCAEPLSPVAADRTIDLVERWIRRAL